MADRDTGDEEGVDRRFDSSESAFQEHGPQGETGPRAGGAEIDDISAVQGDDALLDALAGTDEETADTVDERELNELLLAWRRDIDSEPMAELVDTDTAVTTIRTAATARRYQSRGRKRKAFVPVAVAAAVLAIGFSGTGLAARGAEPGDALWGLSKVLYTERAQSVQAANAARLDLQQAGSAITHGRYHKARQALESAADAIPKVVPEQQRDELKSEHRVLEGKLEPTGSGKATPTTSSPADSTSGTAKTTSPTTSPNTKPSDSQLPPERTTSSEPSTTSSTSPSSTTTTVPTPSLSDDERDSQSGTSPRLDTQGDGSEGVPSTE